MTLLRVRNLRVRFPSFRGVVRAVDGVSFDLAQGQVMGIVGESGSGKSVTALTLMRLLSRTGHVSADELTFDGTDLRTLTEADLRRLRTRRMAMIFQDPMRALNPVLTIGRQITETVERHLNLHGRAARLRALELLERVGLTGGEARLKDYPHQLSGGMRQRVMIAIALSCKPQLLIADEATTALDVTIQAQIVDLVRDLQRELGMAVIWIAHDLGLVAGLCDHVAVMYAGRFVESGSVRDVFYRPSHGYTVGLMRCSPRIDMETDALQPIEGRPPDLTRENTLCAFLPRCGFAVPDCQAYLPAQKEVEPNHKAACFADLKAHWKST